jgi:hypothetical protein
MAIAPGEGITQAQAIAATIAAQKQAAANAAAAAQAKEDANIADSDARLRALAKQSSIPVLDVVPKEKTVTGTSYRGSGASRVLVTTYSDGSTTESPAPEITNPDDADWTSQGNQALYKGVPYNGMRNGLQFINGYRQDMYNPDGTERTTKPLGTTLTNNGGVTQSAKDIVNGYLREAGLAALSEDAWKQWNSGTSAEQIMDWVRTTPDYAKRFPAMATLRASGRSISEAQYVAKEQADVEMMTSYGIPAEIATNRDLLGKLIANNVNQVDLQKRLIAGQESVMSLDKSVLKYAADTFGLTPGDLTAFVLNPDLATPVIEQKARAIQIGGAAFQASQKIAGEQALNLAAAGVTGAQAQQGFGNIAQQQQLTQALPGDISGSVNQEELINAQFGMSPEALARTRRVAGTRAAEYQQGGQFVSGQGGVTGLGSAPQV